MREAHVRDSKQRVARLHCRHTNFTGTHKGMTRNNLFGDRHRALRLFSRSFQRWRRYLTGHSRFVVVEESTIFDDVFGDWIEAARELFERNLFLPTNAFNQAEVG